MPTKYLDMGGLTHYDTKIKSHISSIASGKVPYTGATSDVALGTHKITANTLNLSTTSGANTYTGTIQLTSSGALRMAANAASKAYLFPTAQTEAEAVVAVQSWVNSQISSASSTLETTCKNYAKDYTDGEIDDVKALITSEANARADIDSLIGGRLNTLENAGYITASANNLSNYYTKSQVYTKTEVDGIVSNLNLGVKFVKVNGTYEDLPAIGEPGVIYLVPHTHGNLDAYDEYICTEGDGGYEKIGNTDINLSGYVPTSRTVNGKALSSNITIGAGDIAFSSSDTYSNNTIGAALKNKVDKVSGKGLSANDFTTTLKNKLDGIASGAQVNVIEGVQLNGTDLTLSSKKANIQIKRNGTALAVTSGAVDITVPTKVSDLTNDSGFITGVTSITDAEIDALFAS